MASGKGHSKGFHYYMSKKFFHPGNPINLEAVFVARQNHERKKKDEAEKMSEYQREQEAYEAKTTLAVQKGKTQLDRDKLALSFMYEPPVGVRGAAFNTPASQDPFSAAGGNLELKGRSVNEKGEPFCFKCNKGFHKSDHCPKDGEPIFEWQRNAPREEFLGNDGNVVDKPFGIQVDYHRCMRCGVMGHSHTEKHCPLYGKARDHDQPEAQQPVDERKLIAEMRDKEGLVFNSFDVWDNGKNQKGRLKRKDYDMVFSSEEDNKDLLIELVTKMKTKKKSKSKKSKKHRDKEEKEARRRIKKEVKKEKGEKGEKETRKKKKKKKEKKKDAEKMKRERDIKNLEEDIKNIKKETDIKPEILTDSETFDSEDEPVGKKRKSKEEGGRRKSKKTEKKAKEVEEIVLGDSDYSDYDDAPKTRLTAEARALIDEIPAKKLTPATMAKIDEILFADIGKLHKMDKVDKVSHSFMSEVDKILSLGETTRKDTGTEDSEDSSDSDSEESEEEEEEEKELDEEEMRLLNMININKIDVKLNFPKDYPDTCCHFCREPEDSRHLAQCPVYSQVMRGSEFSDLESDDVGRVRRALANIRAALHQRSQALSFTSLGDISKRNMQLLTLSKGSESSLGEKSRLVEEILGTS